MADLSEIIREKFHDKNILIVGDLVADQFLQGTIARVSREAPVFILKHENTETLAGGAANAAANVASLGGSPMLVGVIGDDQSGKLLCEALRSAGVDCGLIISHSSFKTTTKTRVLAGQHYAPKQQVIRIDHENDSPIEHGVLMEITDRIFEAAKKADAIILSDYNYGVADPLVARAAIDAAATNDIPLIVDSRFRLTQFPNATSATPNQEEVEQILGKDFTYESCEKLRSTLGYKALLVTRGNDGMLVLEEGRKPLAIEAVGSKQPVDVTGAGDTVIAVYALGLSSGLSFVEAARVANHAGGIVVMKRGTASVTIEELIDSLRSTADRIPEAAAGPV
jgi:rfaE bifunctional protein kinase chain/domain